MVEHLQNILNYHKYLAWQLITNQMHPRPGLCYAMDFVHDRLANGQRFKCFTMTDLCSKEGPVIEVDTSISGSHVCRILDRIFAERSFHSPRS